MQWRRHAGEGAHAAGELAGMRCFLGSYVGGFPGAGVRGGWAWLRDRMGDGDGDGRRISLADALHDNHLLERQAEVSAQAFMQQQIATPRQAFPVVGDEPGRSIRTKVASGISLMGIGVALVTNSRPIGTIATCVAAASFGAAMITPMAWPERP